MGLDANGTRLLLYARRQGVSFARTATLGRQVISATPAQLGQNLRDFGLPHDEATLTALYAEGGFAEPLLRLLGAEQILSLDCSAYEGATHLLDLNEPLPEELHGTCTLVLDSGTLEHIYNLPVALTSCVQLLVPGGHFLGISPANDFMGHGFYQFSPELYWRVFGPHNGCETREVIVFEDLPGAPWYASRDPESMERRVEQRTRWRVYVAGLARRVSGGAVTTVAPQQSDYVAVWGGSTLPNQIRPNLLTALKAHLSPGLRHHPLVRRAGAWGSSVLACSRSPFDPRDYVLIPRRGAPDGS